MHSLDDMAGRLKWEAPGRPEMCSRVVLWAYDNVPVTNEAILGQLAGVTLSCDCACADAQVKGFRARIGEPA